MRGMLTVLFFTILAASTAAAQDETILRHDNFLVFDGQAGQSIAIEVASFQKSAQYGEDVIVEVIDPDSERTLRELVPLDETRVIDYSVAADGAHAVRISTGWNTATATISGAAWALVAWRDVPINICGGMAPLHFKVLEGATKFVLHLSASVTNEGATVRLYAPDGSVVLDRTDDFDNEERIEIEVPEGADDAIWRVTVTNPEHERLYLDDVLLYLSGPVPPYLVEDPEHLAPFVSSARYQPDIIDVTVPVTDRIALQANTSETVTWQMQELPQDCTYALRIGANDVDYPRELIVSINGGEEIAVPITGNSTSDTFTLLIPREALHTGDNSIKFTQYAGGGSNVVVVESAQILIGQRIKEYRGY